MPSEIQLTEMAFVVFKIVFNYYQVQLILSEINMIGSGMKVVIVPVLEKFQYQLQESSGKGKVSYR